jgi:biopolymer transport protein ExbB
MRKLSVLFIALIISTSSLRAEDIPQDIVKTEEISTNEIATGDTLLELQENLANTNKIIPVIKPIKKEGALNIKEIFYASPIIYSILFIMSVSSCAILLYTLFTFRKKDLISKATVEDIKDYLLKEQYEEALNYCESKKNLLASMLASGIYTRKHGAQYMIETIKSEGKRATSGFWHRISILNDIVIIAPMLGLLGTVIGMFYAFYDINRSIDSLSALFDGLGIAVGTTVAGLIVAIVAMCFYTILKFKMIKTLNVVENEAVSLGNLIKTKE